MFERVPDRRNAPRVGTAGRRNHERHVLTSEVVVDLEVPGRLNSTANILDISLSGAYLLMGGGGIAPVVNQDIDVLFCDLQFNLPKRISAIVKYVNESSFVGMSMYGMGVEFIREISGNFIHKDTDDMLSIAGTQVAIRPNTNIALPGW